MLQVERTEGPKCEDGSEMSLGSLGDPGWTRVWKTQLHKYSQARLQEALLVRRVGQPWPLQGKGVVKWELNGSRIVMAVRKQQFFFFKRFSPPHFPNFCNGFTFVCLFYLAAP